MDKSENIKLDKIDIEEILNGRINFYQTLSSLYFMPLTQQQIESMAVSNLSDYEIENDLMSEGIHEISMYLKRLNSGTRRELAVDYTMSFGGIGNVEDDHALPVRSLFMKNSSPHMFAEGYREAFATYKKNYVKKTEGLDYPDDHISFMFQFMAILTERAISCLNEDNVTEALENLKESKKFLEQQIISWFPALRERAEMFITTKFYVGVLKMTQGYLDNDVNTLEVIIDTLKS